MKKYLLIVLFSVLLCISASAQKLGKPTLTATEPTADQKILIQQGIELHDEKNYDEAIKLYQQVLKENPDCDLAIYELAFSYYAKPDFPKALETAYKLVQYKGNRGVLGFGLLANIVDDQGNPTKAIEIYQSAIKALEGDPAYQTQISSLYFNLAVTHTRLKQPKEAREALKTAISYDFKYPSPNYLLAEVFYSSKYKIPALLAAGRFLTLELNTQRSNRARAIFLDILKAAEKDEKGNIQIFLDLNAPKDEGDFGAIELFLGTLTTIKSEKDKNKSEAESFADGVDTLIALLSENKKIASTFVGKTYLPFMVELKKQGYVKHFAYVILQQNGNAEAEKWLIDSGPKTLAFLNWAKSYQPKIK